jgi:hypothetical protein
VRGGMTLGLISLAALAAAGLSRVPGAVLGAAVGLGIGAVYAATLLMGIRRLPRLGAAAALRAVQLGSVVRLGFALAGFALAAKWLPAANLGWAAATALVPLLWSLARVAREGKVRA